jgi:tail lysozyme
VPVNGISIAYLIGGGIVFYSGIKGSTLSDTVKGVLTGDLASIKNTEPIQIKNSSSSSGSSGAGGPGPAVSGSVTQNGTTIYKYLRSNGYNPMQAAGAIASIYGESTYNPESQGTGGRGLIGWTPASTLPDSAFTGNASHDMGAQLPLILKFVADNGDQGAVNMMAGATSVSQAAQIWGKRVERYGINDVHTAGVDLAVQIANQVDGVHLAAN